MQNLIPCAVDKTQALGSDSVLLDIKADGINFRDVLNVLGMYSKDPGPPGGDCAGVIVSRDRTGESVIGLVAGNLGSRVYTLTATVAPMPGCFTHEVATMPTAFIAIDTALHHTRLIADSILVISAAGGVGLAAIQLA